jgi:Ca2+-binding RTX toxin-like protein
MRVLLISLITGVAVILLFSLGQTSWGAVIICPIGVAVCNGTPDDDLITGTTDDAVIHGLGGDDYITGYLFGNNYIYGDDGNDILIGRFYNDGLYGGNGNDKYDGFEGDDTIVEEYHKKGSLINNDDIISGGLGNDHIVSGEGRDRIHSGPGNDFIRPNGDYRDFSSDSVNCGLGSDGVGWFYSSEDTALNCEQIYNADQ